MGGFFLALRPTHPKKILTQNLAEGSVGLDKAFLSNGGEGGEGWGAE